MAGAVRRRGRSGSRRVPRPVDLRASRPRTGSPAVWHAYCQPDGSPGAASTATAEGRAMRQISCSAGGYLWRLGGFLGALLLAAVLTPAAWAGGTLTVAMTAGDIPVTTGNPDQGFEGYRFVGYNLYDGLLLWDLSKYDKPSEVRPGLATSYEVDPNDHKRWIVHLRHGVTWHDGCKFTADDVIWNFQMRTDQKAANFSTQQFTYTRAFLTNVKSVSKIDDYTVAFENNFVESLFPYTLSYVLMISPCRAKEVNYDWAQYALHPSGTGPYKYDRVVPHQRLELVANTDYWDKDRIPKHDRLVLIPMPEASTRTAALLTGQV